VHARPLQRFPPPRLKFPLPSTPSPPPPLSGPPNNILGTGSAYPVRSNANIQSRKKLRRARNQPRYLAVVIIYLLACCCGRYGTCFLTVFVISVAYSGCLSRIRLFSIPDPGSKLFPSRIRIKEFKYFNPKKWFTSSRKYDPGCSSRIRILTFYPSRIKKAPDLGSGSATLFEIMLQVSWDKKSIQDHVLDSHFLDLEGYARLYVVPLLGIRKSRPVKKDQSRPVRETPSNGGQEQTRPMPATQATCHTLPSARVDAVLYSCPLAVDCPARFRIEVIYFFPFCR
jgi:hypothetical protein